jgi:hypothetical protein
MLPYHPARDGYPSMFEADEAETQIASGESAIPGNSTVRSGWFARRLVIANQPANKSTSKQEVL